MSINRDKLGLFLSFFLIGSLVLVGCGEEYVPPAGEVEATEFQGVELTPMRLQGNNALAGTQSIDRESYVLTVNGLTDNAVTLSYQDLLDLPQQSRLITLHCVEGWEFVAKVTGPTMASIFALAGVKAEADTVIFYTTDVPEGYTSLELAYIQSQDIMLALKINDLTLPPSRGFPFQVVAVGKYGYKWAKWVTRIELSTDTAFRGYWESRGFNNNADITGPRFD
ncbi:MAG: molybdopterin-dependent oxidoreductase [Dehalogenimonas sp.]|uniref:Molybdopterin-dependent oxidoreductase n=1 Tax=Candidatus Dehalogenimonas loeffleri TaxID=3127115 RepID=A0ABZ2J9Q0_9CHLR|nr:molybdopterin-dependent oxidoreductase [Dehalogenimonas sp.]